ncbi:MAG: hypothetical protein FWD28_10115 [Treponema sp.]|nr:hypothetical protein [Treponema sp.]
MKIQYVIILLSICFFVGCSNTESKLDRYIKLNCNFKKSDVCYIDIKEVLNVDFDEMYIFYRTVTKDEISEVIGIPYSNKKIKDDIFDYDLFYYDNKYWIILLKNKKIVYEDEFSQSKLEFAFFDNSIDENSWFPTYYTTSIFRVERFASNEPYRKYVFKLFSEVSTN